MEISLDPALRKYAENSFLARLKKEKLFQLFDCAVEMRRERNLDKLLVFIATRVTSALTADRCGIFLFDQDKNEIYSRVALGEAKELRFPLSSGVAGQTIRTGEIILTNDPYNNKHFNKEMDASTGYRTKNILCVPLLTTDGQTVGCLQALNKETGDFDDVDEEFLVAFAALAASEIISAKLFKEKASLIDDLYKSQDLLREKISQLEALSRLDQFSYDGNNLSEFLQLAIVEATKGTNARSGSILLYNAKEDNLSFAHNVGEFDEELKAIKLPKNAGIAGRVFCHGQSVYSNNVKEDPELKHYQSVDDALGHKTVSLAATPIKSRDEKNKSIPNIGVLEVINHESNAFTETHLNFLESVSAQVSARIIRHELLEEKEKNQRFTAIGQLAATIVHDFKSPMSVIRGSADLIRRGNLSPEKTDKYTRMITGQIERCNNMILDILEFSQGRKNYKIQKVKIEDLFTDVDFMIGGEAEKKGVIFANDVKFKGYLEVDAEKIKRVLFNLLGNALEVLNAGDKVTISCGEEDDSVLLRVSDTGPGIPAEIQNTLFEAFVTHGKKHGTGLGLSIVKGIVEGHGGEIYLDTTVKCGATFVVKLPKSKDQA